MDALGVVLVHWHLAKMMARSVKACLRDLLAAFIYVYNLFNLMKILLNIGLDGFVWLWCCHFCMPPMAVHVKADFRGCVTGSPIGISIAQFLMLFP